MRKGPLAPRVRTLTTVALGTVLLFVLTPTIRTTSSETPAMSGAPDTACAAHADDSADYVPVRSAELAEQMDLSNRSVPYTFDDADRTGPFDRIGYCLELIRADTTQWVWVSMEATTSHAGQLGLPTLPGQVVRRRVDDLAVRSNVSAVRAVTGTTGWLEMWPYGYSPRASRQVSGASSALLDADDFPVPHVDYGSFQVHRLGAENGRPATVFAVNGFTASHRPLDVGIGSAPDDPATSRRESPDWTFAGNAGKFQARRLSVYVRPAVVKLARAPLSRQLHPRPGHAAEVAVPLSGRVVDRSVDEVSLTVTRGPDVERRTLAVGSGGAFATTVRVPVSLGSTDVELRARGDFGERLVHRAVDVVAGDVYVVHGQSNAVARQRDGTSSEADRSRWIRSFGSSHPDAGLSVADRVWHLGVGDTAGDAGAVGQWALRMAKRIVDTYRVPVAVVNGGHSSQPVTFFQRNDADPADPSTNYGRLLRRLRASGLASGVDALLWYQGEAERNDARAHVTGFTGLLTDLRSDLTGDRGAGLRVYVHQVRTSPCQNAGNLALRDAQRRLADDVRVTVLSTNGLDGHDGCHFGYRDGYRDLGDHNFAVIARDFYRGPTAGVAPPDPVRAVASGRREIVVELRNPGDTLRVDPGVAAHFRVNGRAVVSRVTHRQGVGLVLSLRRDVPRKAMVGYVGHMGAGPWVRNAVGAGLLAFGNVPVFRPSQSSQPA